MTVMMDSSFKKLPNDEKPSVNGGQLKMRLNPYLYYFSYAIND